MGIAFDKGLIKKVDEKLSDFFPAFEKGDNWDRRKDDVTLHKGKDEIFETIFAAVHGGQRVMVVPKLNLVAVFYEQAR
jgi:hypothetical protein